MRYKRKNYAFDNGKKQLELQTSIAEAKEGAYAIAEVEEQNQFHILDKTHESVNLETTSNFLNLKAISEQVRFHKK